MNATGIIGWARFTAVIAVLVLAAVAGLVVGNALQGRPQDTTNAGYPVGYAGGAAVPISRTAEAVFSLDAMDDLAATRDTDAPAADYADYGQRHLKAVKSDSEAQAETLRHPQLR